MTVGIGHNGGPSLDDPQPLPPSLPWFDLDAIRKNGKPRRPMERTTSRSEGPALVDLSKPLLGRRIHGHKDIKNSLNGGPLRRQKVTPWRPVPLKPYVMDTTGALPRTRPGQLDYVENANTTKRLPYMEELRAGRLSEQQAAVISVGLAVKPTRPPQISVHLNSILQKARAGADMKDLAPAHLDIAAKRQAEAGRIVLRCAADAARATATAQIYRLASEASEALLAMRKKARGGARSGAGRKTAPANDNVLISYKKAA